MDYMTNDLIIEYEKNNDNIYAILSRYWNLISINGVNNESIKRIVEDIVFLTRNYYVKLNASFVEDLKEVDSCFSAGAYKATLIMVGSCLEAFLISWLSEIDGVDYFNTPCYRRDENGEFVRTKDHKKIKAESLSDYIERIEAIERPDWMEEARKAHIIRKHRNSVHAKVCLKEELEINKDTCEMVITYLKEIIGKRLDLINEHFGIDKLLP